MRSRVGGMTNSSPDAPVGRGWFRWLLTVILPVAVAGGGLLWHLGGEKPPGVRPLDPAHGIVLRLNCGGPTLGEPGMDNYWESDAAYAQGGRLHSGGRNMEMGEIPELGPMELYQTVRRSNHYFIFRDLAPGRYTVRLHFIDSSKKKRLYMDYVINGVKVLNGFDVATEAGGKNRPLVKEFVTEVRHDLRILASEDDGLDVFEAGLEIIRGGGEVSPAAADPGRTFIGRKGQSGSDAPVPDDLPWLRRECGDGALAYSADARIFLVELADGMTREIGQGCCVEFSPDGTKLAWIDGVTVKGRLRKGDPIVRTVQAGVRPEAGVHWVGNEALVVELDTEAQEGWHRISLDGKTITPLPEIDALGPGLIETDVKLCEDGVWSYVSERQWATSDGKRGLLSGNCSVSLSPDGLSATALLPGHRMCHLDAIREGGISGRMNWLYDEGFDNHRWSSNDPRFVVCLDEASTGMVIALSRGAYATRMGKAGRAGGQMYGDFTVGAGEGGIWETR